MPWLGGWDPETGVVPADIDKEIDQAFANVELNLKHAGGKGWSQVYKVRSYHCSLDMGALTAMGRNMRKWCPDHAPIWTCIGVAKLAEGTMNVEIEVEAYDPK